MKKIAMIILAVSAFAGMAQGQTFTLIAAAKTNRYVGGTNTYFAQYTNEFIDPTFTIKGKITSPFLSKSGDTEIFIQDTTAAIRVRGAGTYFAVTNPLSWFKPGAELTVKFGVIEQANGMRSIRVDLPKNFYISNTNALPITPRQLTVDEYFADGETREGDLVMFTNLNLTTVPPLTYGVDAGFNVTQVSGGITNIMQVRVDKDTDVPGQLPPTNTFDLIGIAQQYSVLPVPSNGYQVLVFAYSNIIQQGLGLEPCQLLVSPVSTSAKVGRQVNVTVIGQDRNASDILTITTNQTIAGAIFTNLDSRVWRFSWTPGVSDAGTTHTAVFSVTDGVYTNTAETVITVSTPYPAGYAWLNEFHYDNASTDVDEGIEVAGAAGVDLTEYYVLAYNGNGAVVYASNTLSGTIDNEGNGYGAVWFPLAGLQNGAPDGIALVHKTYGLLDFISYEGGMVASNGAAVGVSAFDVGVSEVGTEPAGLSLQLSGDGTNYESFVWVGPIAHTMGMINSPTQTMGGATAAAVSFSDLTLVPSAPYTNVPMNIACTITPNSEAYNLQATAYYTINGGVTNSLSMSSIEYDFQTDSTIAGQVHNTTVRYWVGVTFDGEGTNSPMYSVTNSYTINDGRGPTNALLFQGFEGKPTDTWDFLAAPGGGLTETNSERYMSGVYSLQIAGGTSAPLPTVEMSNESLIGYSNMQLSVAFSASGADSGEDLFMDISYDNGSTWTSSVKLIDGYSNLELAFGATSTTDRVPTASNPYVTAISDGHTQLKVRFRVSALNSGGDTFYIDDVALTGQGTAYLNAPEIVITNPVTSSLVVPNATATYTVQGTASTSVVGQIKWTNSLTGGSGTISAGTSWSIADVALNAGANVITVSGTNNESMVANAGVTITRAPPPADSDLLISEVADPADDFNARFIEIYNAGSIAVDFGVDTYYLSKQANGGTTWNEIQLTGTVTAGDTYLVTINATNFLAKYGLEADMESSGVVNGNGDDAYFLYKDGNHTVGALVDIYGEIDQDGTGRPWQYEDAIATRNSGVTQPSTLWAVDEWTITTPGATTNATPGIHVVSYGPTITDAVLNIGAQTMVFSFEIDGTNLYTLQRSTNLLANPAFFDIFTGISSTHTQGISAHGLNSFYRMKKQ